MDGHEGTCCDRPVLDSGVTAGTLPLMGNTRMIALLVLVLAGAAWAQSAAAVTGRVFDADQQSPVEYANVVLYSLPESTQVTGAVTDATGAFRLEGVKPGRYYVELSFIGFKDRVVKEVEVTAGAACDLGRIVLEPKPIAVPGVEAVGQKPAISYEIDKKVVDVTKLPNASSGTAVDALRNVPSVKVDIDDNVTLRGSSNFKVLIDGKPTELDASEALKQIPSATIQNIEIITNPSAKYEPDGAAGIMNVVLKKQKGRGISALANANAGLKNRYGGDLLLGYKQGIANTYVGGNLNHYVFSGNSRYERRTFGGGETLSITTLGSYLGGPMIGGGRAGLELQEGPSDKSSVSGRVRGFRTGGDNSTQVTEHYAPGDSSRSFAENGSWRWGGKTYFALVDHEHDFDTAGHKLTGRVSLSGRAANSLGRNAELGSSGDTTGGFRNEQGGPWRSLNITLDYTRPKVAGGEFDAGYDGSMDNTDGHIRQYWYSVAAHDYVFDSLASHAYSGSEDIHALYATWSGSWKKLGVQPGLRGEYGNRVIAVPDMDSTYKMSRWDLFPTLHLSYSLPANQQVTASYSRRIDRPGPWDLTPFLVWDDAHSANEGNPRLTPQYTDSYEAGYELPFGGNSANANLYYRTTTDLFTWVTIPYAADSTVLLQTSRNVGRDHSLGGEFSASLSPFQWLTINPDVDLYKYSVKGALLGQDFSRGSFAWNGSLNLDFHVPFGTQLQVNANYYAPTVSAQGTDGGWFGTDVAVKQSLLNRGLSITLRVNNLFDVVSWKSVSEGPGFYTSRESHGELRVFTLALSYNLNSFRMNPKMREGEGSEMQGGPSR